MVTDASMIVVIAAVRVLDDQHLFDKLSRTDPAIHVLVLLFNHALNNCSVKLLSLRVMKHIQSIRKLFLAQVTVAVHIHRVERFHNLLLASAVNDDFVLRDLDTKQLKDSLQLAAVHLGAIAVFVHIGECKHHLAHKIRVRNVDLVRRLHVVVLARMVHQLIIILDLRDVQVLDVAWERARTRRRVVSTLDLLGQIWVIPSELVEMQNPRRTVELELLMDLFGLCLAFLRRRRLSLPLRDFDVPTGQITALFDVGKFGIHDLVQVFHVDSAASVHETPLEECDLVL